MADDYAALFARGEQAARDAAVAFQKLGVAVAALGRQLKSDAPKIHAAIDKLDPDKAKSQ